MRGMVGLMAASPAVMVRLRDHGREVTPVVKSGRFAAKVTFRPDRVTLCLADPGTILGASGETFAVNHKRSARHVNNATGAYRVMRQTQRVTAGYLYRRSSVTR
jgi:hypothetical protein